MSRQYIKYKIKLKQKGGFFTLNYFYIKYPYEKIKNNEKIIILFEKIEYDVIEIDYRYLIYQENSLMIEIRLVEICGDVYIGVVALCNECCVNLLNEIIKMFNLSYVLTKKKIS